MSKRKEGNEAPTPAVPQESDLLAAANFEINELKARNAILEAQSRTREAVAPDSRGSLDPASLNHPNAFKAGDGRTYYKYTGDDGDVVVFPKPLEQMTEEDFYRLPISLYDNAPGRLPNNLTVEFKDPQWAGFWFNRKAGDGARISTGLALGYVSAKIEDLKIWHKSLNDKDGAVEQHDLVLMKIHKYKLYMKYAEWINKAKMLGSISGYKNRALENLNPANREKDPYFFTPQALKEFQGLGPVAHIPTVSQ